jgi:HD-like signal output (HDOD) protein
MVTKTEIENYLKEVPALPTVVRQCLTHLQEKELNKAAIAAKGDQKLIQFLKTVVNSAAYGFRSTMSDEKQIFSALGAQKAKQLLYAYMVDSTAPNRWEFFKLQPNDFKSLQMTVIKDFNTILRHYGHENSEYQSVSSIICATIVVADKIFGDHKEDVDIVLQSQDISLDELLHRISGYTFASLVTYIAKLWEVHEDARGLLILSFGDKSCEGEVCEIAKLMHLRLFKTLSQPVFIQAGLNDFLELKMDFVQDILQTHEKVFDETDD